MGICAFQGVSVIPAFYAFYTLAVRGNPPLPTSQLSPGWGGSIACGWKVLF